MVSYGRWKGERTLRHFHADLPLDLKLVLLASSSSFVFHHSAPYFFYQAGGLVVGFIIFYFILFFKSGKNQGILSQAMFSSLYN